MKKKQIVLDDKLLIGRSEWCGLPKLNVTAIKAKIDTGAKTSAIHAFNIQAYTRSNKEFVRFDIHPLQHNDKKVVHCHAAVFDKRFVMSSNGHKERRYVIVTKLQMGEMSWEIELSLSNRDPLRFRLLLGREALNKRVLIDPSIAYVQRKK